MNLTQKETTLLSDLKSQEQLCIDKYGKYESEACDPALKQLFSSVKDTEMGHLKTLNQILAGESVSLSSPPSAAAEKLQCTPSTCSEESKKNDAFLCKDALAMEKHVSSVYDISVFEFTNPALRDALSHIQKEEQNHGEKFYNYLACNNMYN